MEIKQLNLKKISLEIKEILAKDNSIAKGIKMIDYHGFKKVRIKLKDLSKISKEHNINDNQIQIEIVRVEKDLSKEIHRHKSAHAFCIILGDEDGFEEAKNSRCFVKDKWSDIHSGDQIDIPSNTSHGFTIGSGGSLVFLSIQSPPIEGIDGSDDYYKI